ncbi:MAG: hypothetical protein ACP5D9_10740 [Mariniphaga sp.]
MGLYSKEELVQLIDSTHAKMLLSLDYFATIERKTAAKSRFNMALAYEMLNQLNAAVDWAVQSYHVFGQKNPVHEKNCLDYIKILSQRKLDIKRIEYQFNPKPIFIK